jgi:hypothetical protein
MNTTVDLVADGIYPLSTWVDGWRAQMPARGLAVDTINGRCGIVSRCVEFTNVKSVDLLGPPQLGGIGSGGRSISNADPRKAPVIHSTPTQLDNEGD